MYVRRKGKNRILFFLGFLICVLPLILNFFFHQSVENVISSFYLEEEKMDEGILESSFNVGLNYNQNLYLGKEKEAYETMLNTLSSSVIATIQIPVIDVDLPIYRGTSDEVLNRGIGHFDFTSLPVGGQNSHCILTGHRGLPSAKLFTRLDELKKKDLIYIHVCKKELVYEVVDSIVVEPKAILDMGIEKNRDLLSLVTCTPYGINTKRLVVRAKRVFPKKKEKKVRKSYSFRELCFILIPIICVMVEKIGLIILMMIACIMPINANSISVELQDSVDELSKENVEFNVVQVAKLVDGFYVLNEEFQDLDVDFNTELLAEEVEAICTKLSGYSLVGQTLVTDEEGKAVLEDVEEGLYFIDPVNINEYERMSPMLVSVPEWDGDTLNYDVLMYPKHRPFEKLIIKKIDKDSKDEILDSIEFTSFKDKDCTESLKTFKGNGTLSILMREDAMYLKETKAPNGYEKSDQVLFVEVKDDEIFIDGKKVENNEFLFENKKIHVPTGIEYHGNMYVTLGLIALVVILHLINKKLRK